jgi:transcriptional regulator with XRE-family HTH domain
MSVEPESAFGRLFREWRTRRRVSQLDLAVETGVSSRHVSFIETGRAQPSREMVLMLARVLDVPLRDRNELLMAAGYAACIALTDLDAPALEQARRALDFMLRQHEPLSRHRRRPLLDDPQSQRRRRAISGSLCRSRSRGRVGGNAMRLMFHPRGFRPHIVNWEAMAAALIQWLHRDVLHGLGGAETRALLDELLSYPGVPPRWRTLDLDVSTAPFLAIEFHKGDLHLRFFSTLTSLGTRTTSPCRSCASRRSFCGCGDGGGIAEDGGGLGGPSPRGAPWSAAACCRLVSFACSEGGGKPPHSKALRRGGSRLRKAIAHRRTQAKDLDGRLGDGVCEHHREALVRFFLRGSQTSFARGRRRTLARNGSAGQHAIPECLALQCRLNGTDRCFECFLRTGDEIDGRELEAWSRLWLAGSVRECGQVFIERASCKVAMRRDVDDVVALIVGG